MFFACNSGRAALMDSDEDEGKLFIGGIPWGTSEETLTDYFSRYGNVSHSVIVRDKTTGRSRGFGFVVFSDPSVLDSVLQARHTIEGRTVEAKRALSRGKQQTSRPATSSNVGRSSGGTVSYITKKISVGGLPSTLTKDQFRQYFEAYGDITDVVLVIDKSNSGFGFISYDTEAAVDRVLQKTFHALNNKLIEVKRALPRNSNPGGSGGGGGGRGGGYQGSNSDSYDNQMDANRFLQQTIGGGYPTYSGYGQPAYGFGSYGGSGRYHGAYGNSGYGNPFAVKTPWVGQSSHYGPNMGYGGHSTRGSDYSSVASKRDCSRLNINVLLESLFTVSDSTLNDASFDVVLESRSTNSDQNEFVQRALHILSVLLKAGKRFDLKLSSAHNASVWPLTADLTIKVFSMLDTPSVCSTSATCLFFQKCAVEPLCYADINLTTFVPKVNDDVVARMIQRAGIALRSFKLDFSPPLTRSCLSSLSANGGEPGSRLRRLHLRSLWIDNSALLEALSVCPVLIDLEINALDVDVSPTLESVSKHCPLLERFIYDHDIDGDRDSYLDESVCEKFVHNCPKITTFVLRASKLSDTNARMLVKGLPELKHVDFSSTVPVSDPDPEDPETDGFLKNLGTGGGGKKLEVMILEGCYALRMSAVEELLEALLVGEFRLLRHLDISNTEGLGGFLSSSNLLINQVLEQRPDFCLVAEFH